MRKWSLSFLCGLLVLAPPVFGADIYIAQNSTGADSGADCANAHSASWFNKYAAGGNSYHLCGTFSGSAGSTMLTVPSSGSAGSPLTIKFEDGALLTAPYWGTGGAINIPSRSYVTIDGGTNGRITNSANGTALPYHQSSYGVAVSNVNNLEIKNLTINTIYANGGSDPNASDVGGRETANIKVYGATNNVSIHHNVLDSARSGIDYGYNGTTDNIRVYNNTIRDHCWGIVMGETSGGTPTITNVEIYNNEITGWLNWQCPANADYCTNKTDAYHTDGIILWQTRGGSFSPKVFNNYIHGDLGKGSGTAFIYCTVGTTNGTSNESITCLIYNNLLVQEGTAKGWIIGIGHGVGTQIYNNTLISTASNGMAPLVISSRQTRVKNNIVVNGGEAYATYVIGPPSDIFAESDYNVWKNINSGAWRAGLDINYNWASWQSLGFDRNSSLADPLLSTSYKITSDSSSAFRRGTNLTNLGIPTLNVDKSNLLRPVSGAWDAGVYNYSGAYKNIGQPPLPPAILTIR